MKTPTSSLLSREIAHWRHFFRTRDAAIAKANSARPRAQAQGEDDGDSVDPFADTEWADTDWAITNFDGEH